MVAFLPGLVLAVVCVVLLIYSFRSHERHWSLGFLGWRKVYLGLGIALCGGLMWALGEWLGTVTSNPGIATSFPIAAGILVAAGLGLVVAGSMERLHDLAEERRRLEEVRAGFDLYDTLREVVSGPYTFLEVLEFALKEMVRASGVTTGGLWLYNPSGREWILTGSANMSQTFRRQVETVRGSGTGFDRLARLYKAHVFSRTDDIRLFFPEWEAEGIQSVLGLPLVTGSPGSSEKRLLGVIILADTSEARFDDDRARRLHAAADYVAAVIAEGRLQRQLDSSAQQMEALKSAHDRDLESLREQMRTADARVADERRAWEREANDRIAEARAEIEESRKTFSLRLESMANEHAFALSQVTAERDAIRADGAERLTAAQHQIDVVVARLEEQRRATDEEKRRMTDEAQTRITAERARYDQALAEIRSLESSHQSLHAQLENQRKTFDIERLSLTRKIEALESQIVRERNELATESQRSREALQTRIAELEALISGVEQEHERRLTEMHSHIEEERHHAVDEQRVLKQEIQSLRMALVDQQAQFAAERDALAHEARQVETRYVQLLDAERDAQEKAREDWEAMHEASEQMLLDLKLELENTRFEQGMALARAHNESEQIRSDYEDRLSSLQDQVQMLEEALMAPPPGLTPDDEFSGDPGSERVETSQAGEESPASRELHGALLDWVSRQEQDEWHLELSAHETPSVPVDWLAARLDEARRMCRDKGPDESMAFSIRTESLEDRTVLMMMRLAAVNTFVEESDDLPPAEGNLARWLYDGDDRIGMEITFGSNEAPAEEHMEPGEDVIEPSLDSMSVLVVDDQLEMQEIVTDMLISLGHASTTSASVQDAYSRYIAGSFDIVLISADLPQEEGYTLAQWIKSHRVDMPVIMMVDAGAKEMVELVDATLIKPFAIEQLHECLIGFTETGLHGHVSVRGYDDVSDD